MPNSLRLTAALACLSVALVMSPPAMADIALNNTVSGEPLNLDDAPPEGKDSAAFKEFMQSGKNPYVGKQDCFAKGEELFNGACSGCHGHLAEGKIGPGLNDDYWTYPQNATDKGMFETIFGGASGQMGPMYNSVNVQEMLLAMAWVRHLYIGDPEKAEWLEADARKTLKKYDNTPAPKPGADAPQECKMGG
ncbi:cytochrome c(L), periplasmic [Hansschlegelia zhihuaiae]|uniref:Cytochrome c-L n=1 Tax=Hansschlegelia zhihuaiae TaxID=405005 RepID=A0A4Q0MJH1_9HYPH|nr:cytochrome c(L), periplasmic [Hansschlegelia zhihuaiae]RXF73714.1 cytochrome c(L), periplasmic [Hansschlegelia zhihuaiae]